MIRIFCVLVAAILSAGSALASDPPIDESIDEAGALDGFTETGETVNCVSMRSTGVDAVDETRLLFKVGSRYYLNEVKGRCDRVGSPFNRIEVRLFGPRACSGDIFNIVDNQSGLFEGSCSLGDFRRLEKKPAAPTDSQTQ